VLVGLALFPFGVGAYNYFTPWGYTRLTPDRADFRDAFHALGARVKPEDTIVLADNPAHGMAVAQFYWKGSPPAAIYSALDPRLYERKGGGDVYWVVTTLDVDLFATGGMELVEAVFSSDSRWTVVYSNHRVMVLKENLPQAGILASAQYMADKWLSLSPNSRLGLGLRGSVYQASGELEQAVASYDKNYSPFNLSKEYLETANAFALSGDMDKAWREAVTAKLEDAGSPDVHRWMGHALQVEGYTALGLAEERIAEMLDGSR
jgi:hypothetical protein